MKSIDVVNKYLGIPFKHKGRTLEGLDCYGLIIRVYDDLGYKILDIEDYDESWSWRDKNYFTENYYKEWVKVQVPNLYDVIMFKNVQGISKHAGIVLEEGKFIHTSKAGTVLSRYEQPEWQKRFEGFYHLKERVC